MAQELVVHVHCDRHLREHGVKTNDAATVALTFDGKPRYVDLCPPCTKELVDPVRELVTTYGRRSATEAVKSATTTTPDKPGRTYRPHGRYPCPDPDCDEAPASGPGYRNHRRYAHGVRKEDEPMPLPIPDPEPLSQG